MATNKFRVLYQFSIPYFKEVEETSVSQDAEGNEVRTTKKVQKEISRRACLKKPNRTELDEALLYYNITVNEGMKRGLVSKISLGRLYDNDGGTMSQPEMEEYARLYRVLFEIENERQRLSGIADDKISEADKKKLADIIEESATIKRRLQNFEASQSAIFDITAENRARTKTILWWLLHLLYVDTNYEKALTIPNLDPLWMPVFPGSEVEERLDVYDDIEEGENLSQEDKDFYFRLVQRAVAACAFWYYGRATSQAQFEYLENELASTPNDVTGKLPGDLNVPAPEDKDSVEEPLPSDS